MRRIELRKTVCAKKVGKDFCLFLLTDSGSGHCNCILDLRRFSWRKYTYSAPRRLAFCRREFPDGVIEVRAGRVKSCISKEYGRANKEIKP